MKGPTGWDFNHATDRLEIRFKSTLIAYINASGMFLADSTPIGGGGSIPDPLERMRVSLSVDTAWNGFSPANLPFDVVDYDTASFWDATDKKLVVPSGKAGLYLVHARLVVQDDEGSTLTQITGQFFTDADDNALNNTTVPAVKDARSDAWYCDFNTVVRLDEGDGLAVLAGWFPFDVATLTFSSGTGWTYFEAVRLSP